MKVGDLVRHVVHTGAMGIIVKLGEFSPLVEEAKVHWLNNGWGIGWTLIQNVEVLDESR